MSVNYKFPHIECLDDVLPHVDERFRVVEKDSGHTFINYVMMGNETFPSFEPSDTYATEEEMRAAHLRAAMRRECRGIAFYTDTGKIASRPFHKFHNVGEQEETDVSVLDFSQEHWVCDKVDGSMLRPLMTSSGLRWGTKMGITDTALLAEEWLMEHPAYAALATDYMSSFTTIFEYVSEANRVVVDYGETNMHLLSIRNNITGYYLRPATVKSVAERYGIPSVKMYSNVTGDPSLYFDAVKKNDDFDEGIIVQWWNGHRVKVKTDTYTVLHKVKESSRTERTLVTAILEEKIDDLLPLLPSQERDRIEQYIQQFYENVEEISQDCESLYSRVRAAFATKKEFALSVWGQGMPSTEKSIVFAMWDGKLRTGREAAMRILNTGLKSETKWDDMLQMLETSTNINTFDAGWKKGNEE